MLSIKIDFPALAAAMLAVSLDTGKRFVIFGVKIDHTVTAFPKKYSISPLLLSISVCCPFFCTY
jgi:hypothetical protein